MEKVVTQRAVFRDCFRDKRILVTGHTGFKGSWLTLWLLKLGAKVAGYSKYLPTEPCHFEVLGLKEKIKDIREDVRDFDRLKKVFDEFQPEIVFHLAAQPIVRESYKDAKLTFDTNLGGTVNVLEAVKASPSVKAGVIITSDKCYENVGWDQGYKETDLLGGADPYSASKACAEIAFSAYFRSFFQKDGMPKLCSARAGNVIGGGDWAKDRVVPDCVRAWSQGEVPEIRKPDATRPWQHILEPLSGYLWLAARLMTDPQDVNGESFNFGPRDDVVKSVEELVDLFLQHWGKGQWNHTPHEGEMKEAKLLQLSCEKALEKMNWKPLLGFEETVEMTAGWYKAFYAGDKTMLDVSSGQIDQYEQKAVQKEMAWTQ